MEQGGNARHDERNFRRGEFHEAVEIWTLRSSARRRILTQGDERLQPVTDGVSVREPAFVRQNFPGRVEQRLQIERRRTRADFTRWLLHSTLDSRLSSNSEPCFNVLLEIFLCFQIRRDQDKKSVREHFLEQDGKKRLRCLANTGASQHSTTLQSPGEGLHGGSLRDVSEQVAPLRPALRDYGGRAGR